MKIYFKILGWIIIIPSVLTYLYLWIKALQYVSDKIGGFLATILLLLTNIIGPLLYIIWSWIAEGFDTRYFLTAIGAWIASIIGKALLSVGSED